MGMPIESRLSDAALRLRHRIQHPLPLALSAMPYSRFGIDRIVAERMHRYYEETRVPHAFPCVVELQLVQTRLPTPVRSWPSAMTRLNRVVLGELETYTGGNEGAALETSPRRRERASSPRQTEDEEDTDAETTADDLDWRDDQGGSSDEDDSENDDDGSYGNDSDGDNYSDENEVNLPERLGELLPTTRMAVGALIVERNASGARQHEWQLGCWPGLSRMAPVDVYGILLDLVSVAGSIPSCTVDRLRVMGGLGSYDCIPDGIELAKEYSAEFWADYDRDSDYFLDPITGAKINISM